MTPILSGNYVFKIFEEGGETILHKRFKILESKLTIEAQVRRATLAEDRNTKHEIDFTIKHPNLVIADPFSDIKVHIKQNNKEDNAITDLTPLFVKKLPPRFQVLVYQVFLLIQQVFLMVMLVKLKKKIF